jgi:hypothetical protein
MPDGMGGFESVTVTTYTYNGHKSSVKLGEESIILFSVTAGASNELVKEEITSSLVDDQTRTISGQTYNAQDRPKQASIAITPQPPGYNLQVKYFYQ